MRPGQPSTTTTSTKCQELDFYRLVRIPLLFLRAPDPILSILLLLDRTRFTRSCDTHLISTLMFDDNLPITLFNQFYNFLHNILLSLCKRKTIRIKYDDLVRSIIIS